MVGEGADFRHSVCRVCNKGCPIIAEVVDGRLVSIAGDPDNPLFAGYTCLKGRAMPEIINGPNRLLRSLKRNPAGHYEPIPFGRALDEIARRLQAICEEHGPRSIATYYGTQMQNIPAGPLMKAFANALGTPMNFGALSVDKPGRPIAWAMLGRWMAPPQGFSDPRVIMMLGINPFVNGNGGLPNGHPANWLNERLRSGTELIVIDPRRSDVAKRATLHLQPRPGHDIPIVAAMIKVILQEGLYDKRFTDEDVRNVDELAAAVRPFDVGTVAAHAGISAHDLVRAARIFGHAGRGYAVAGTGPHFAGHGTLLEYLTLCLDTICGHWLKAGETIDHLGVLTAAKIPRAQAADPAPAYGYGEPSRLRGLGLTSAGMPSATLAEEILLDGPGRVRALLSCGGNPVAAFPDQLQTIDAMRNLDLLVQIDPFLSQTAVWADYVIAPRMSPEMAGHTLKIEGSSSIYATGYGFPADYAQYSDPIVEPPAGSEVVEDWEVFYGLARRMGLSLTVTTAGGEKVALDMQRTPTPDELVTTLSQGSRVTLEELKRHPHGAFFPADPPVVVEPKEPGWTGRLDVGNLDMLRDLAAHAPTSDEPADTTYPFRLINRRLMHVVNSSYNAHCADGYPPVNSAFLSANDFAALDLAKGDEVAIESAHGVIRAIVDVDRDLREGTVSMAFGFGGTPLDDARVREIGSSVARLLSTTDFFDPYSGQPLMSNVPIRIRAVEKHSS
ncbi:molybdopterin-dependent oxidoreductase [Amycolatopsis sp. FDAARGOS 1241]|uniref:molybdopterin-containing oxidoreductase family protein n=1 Tax=Amycolatopsis sp. FDAARGOS 1241 TaxID=2778070 RepID=UPI00194E9652|nr:molybdopterin-dependent oxidoreductase [Amycolatopsis sp. FDAARGOS 1241]QRP42937.1 molybdopterin-dependent oxidoreductase [Amycolatopsis sp. FDAARGOS 1241]